MKPKEDQGIIDARLNVYSEPEKIVHSERIFNGAPALLIGKKAAVIIADELGIIDYTVYPS